MRQIPDVDTDAALTMDQIIRRALHTLRADIVAPSWYGREREIVSLFAFGHLLPFCRPGGVLHDPAQIGIEVAVPQHVLSSRKDPDVCKDLVIWPRPKMTTWGDGTGSKGYPLCVVEWKCLNRGDRTTTNRLKRASYELDIEWLRRTSELSPDFTGYAVLVVQNAVSPVMECARVCRGEVDRAWFRSDSAGEARTG